MPQYLMESKKRRKKGKVNAQQEITPETEILIRGKYPDWMLVEETRLYGINS